MGSAARHEIGSTICSHRAVGGGHHDLVRRSIHNGESPGFLKVLRTVLRWSVWILAVLAVAAVCFVGVFVIVTS
jgi:hypothetical protein